jgi:serine/threonine protein kinase/Flp pilus assembly protein TadD
MMLSPGSAIGAYEILALLGAGGMGEVYKARDTRLGRDVALKILPAEVASNPERRARFEQEARAVAALTHPHIVTLYSLEAFQETLFITLELVEGETLAAMLTRERVALPGVLRLGSAIADAVSYAHDRGILHRDLKPANIMLTSDGLVKVLDFGLAKLKEAPAARGGSPFSATTRLGPVTDQRLVLGTPEYMSPEQAEGGELDHRSDIFSLGVVLYELATSERPFRGSSPLSVIASVLRDTPRPITEVNPQAPAELAQIVRRCLSKDPSLRYQTARELRNELDALRQQVEARATPVASPIARPATPARRSVAVLPFLNLSADPENEFFADGITEDVIAQLSKMRSLKVISRTSAMQFKKSERSLGEIAATLGVATLVEGSVRKAGNRVRIVADLVDAATDEHLWAETYDRQLTDIFEIQSDVALSIAEALEAELSPAERARIEKPAAINIEAYQLYLKGRQCLHRFTEAELRKALDFFERSIAVEPRYAPSHTEVAFAHIVLALGHGAGAVRPREAYARARQAVAFALEIDPLYGDAHGALACLKFMADYDWVGAEQSFKRGLELNPGSFFILDAYGVMLSAEERFEEAIAVQRRGRELDPLAGVATSDLATTLLRAGRYDEALREARRLNEMEPAFPLAHSTLGWAYLMKGQSAEGLREIEQAASLSPGNTLFLAQLGEAYAMAGETAKAREVLARLIKMAEERYVMPYHLAYVYTGLGDHDKAIDLLDAAVEERAGGAYGIRGSFLFTPLRVHPRFVALLRKINLAPAATG